MVSSINLASAVPATQAQNVTAQPAQASSAPLSSVAQSTRLLLPSGIPIGNSSPTLDILA